MINFRENFKYQYFNYLSKKASNNIVDVNYIWCLGQSGSFMLYDLLASSGNFSYYGVLKRKKDLVSKATNLKLLPQEGLSQYFGNVGLDYQLENTWVFNEIHNDNLSKIKVDLVKQRYQSMAKAYSKLHSISGEISLPIIDKCPHYLQMVNMLFSVFPESKHIFLIRDPRSVFFSMKKRVTPNIEDGGRNTGYPSGFYGNIYKHEWISKNTNLETNLLRQIIWLLNACLDEYAQYSQNIKVVFYEDILTSPITVVKSCLSHFKQDEVSLDYLNNALMGIYEQKKIEHELFL